ncbi:hypothetical protein [Mesorhizobium sp. M0047]|uniref:hypothetical protein n=1 Tax=Mesorhizobium sp. M0047 TaxID=2956859 RepID=UPI00333B8376
MDVCLQVLRGEAQTPVAKRAFVAAALEAKIKSYAATEVRSLPFRSGSWTGADPVCRFLA